MIPMIPNFRYVQDGMGYPSVTEILKALPKPGLEEWKKKTPNAEIISRDRATIGTITHWKIQCYFAHKFDLPRDPLKVDDLTVLHHNIELCKKGLGKCSLCRRKDEMAMAIPIIYSYAENIFRNYEFKPIYLEKSVFSPELGYAGTMDYYGYLDGKLIIGDWKTSKAIYKDNTFGAQLAAYKHAFEKKVEALFILRMNEKTGPEICEVPDDWELFLEALEKYKELHPDRMTQKVR